MHTVFYIVPSAASPPTKTVPETEAEAIEFVVGATISLNTRDASASYIQLYHGNAALKVIQKTSALILSALETQDAKAAAESDASKPPTIILKKIA